jgi:hypothetical protein
MNVRNAKGRMCPDLEKIKDDWILRNLEFEYKDRASFSIDIQKC